MADWLTTSDGEDLAKEKDGFELKTFGPLIPADTTAIASIEKIGWTTFDGSEFLNIQWTLHKPDDLENRKVFQKLWLKDDDPQAKDPDKKRDNAKRMLRAIDSMAGDPLVKSKRDIAKMDDAFLTKALVDKPMIIKIMVWENGDKSGNYVAAVKRKGTEEPVVGKTVPKHDAKKDAQQQRAKGSTREQIDDDIPF